LKEAQHVHPFREKAKPAQMKLPFQAIEAGFDESQAWLKPSERRREEAQFVENLSHTGLFIGLIEIWHLISKTSINLKDWRRFPQHLTSSLMLTRGKELKARPASNLQPEGSCLGCCEWS
jgi:hypothetical protein